MSGKVTQKTLVLKTFCHVFFFFAEISYICICNVFQNPRRMKGKLKFMFAALLGFSAACSTVKNAPVKGQEEAKGVVTDSIHRPRVVVMYGVRRPVNEQPSRQRMERMRQDSIGPVLEKPADDMPVKPGATE